MNIYISNSCCYYVVNEHSLILILQKLGNKEVVIPLFHCFGTSETQILLYTNLDSCVLRKAHKSVMLPSFHRLYYCYLLGAIKDLIIFEHEFSVGRDDMEYSRV